VEGERRGEGWSKGVVGVREEGEGGGVRVSEERVCSQGCGV